MTTPAFQRTPVPLGGRPRWQPILCAVIVPLSLLWAVSREYWRVWITLPVGKVIIGAQVVATLLSTVSITYIALIPNPPSGDITDWYINAADRLNLVSTPVFGYTGMACSITVLVGGIWLGWKTANELGTPTRPAQNGDVR